MRAHCIARNQKFRSEMDENACQKDSGDHLADDFPPSGSLKILFQQPALMIAVKPLFHGK